MRVLIKDSLVGLIYDRAKRERKRIDALVNELLSKALWNEPSLLFKGKYCQVEPDLFGDNIPKPGDFEEPP